MAKQGRAALLAWCKRVTAGHAGVQVSNFESSFRDGLAFCAIIHHYHPDRIAFHRLSAAEPIRNHRLAFDTAHSLGVPALLDAEDMLPKPEPFSVMTYLMGMYNVFETGSFRGNNSLGKSAPTAASALAPAPAQTVRGGGKASTTPGKRGTIHAPLCAACGSPLSGNVVEHATQLFHAACFTCHACHKPLRTVVIVEQRPHCLICAQAIRDKHSAPPAATHAASAGSASTASQAQARTQNALKASLPRVPQRTAASPAPKLPSTSLREHESARPRRQSRSVGGAASESIKERIARLREEQRQDALAPSDTPAKPRSPRPLLSVGTSGPPLPSHSAQPPSVLQREISDHVTPPPPPLVPQRGDPTPVVPTPTPTASQWEALQQAQPPPILPVRDYAPVSPSLPPPVPKRSVFTTSPTQPVPPNPARHAASPLPLSRPSAASHDYAPLNPFLHRSSTAPAIPPRSQQAHPPVSPIPPSLPSPMPTLAEPMLTSSFDIDEYTSTDLLAGPLRKRDMRVLGISLGLAQVWCVLRAERLVYWKHSPQRGINPTATPLEGSVSLRSCTAITSIGVTGFSLTTPERVYEFEAESGADRDRWVDGLVRALHVYRKIEAYVGVGVQRREGFMDVKSMIGWKKKQYVVLNDGFLFLFLTKSGPRLSKLPLVGSSVTWASTRNAARYAFEVRTESGTTALISSLVEGEARAWMDAISAHQRHIDAALAAIVA